MRFEELVARVAELADPEWSVVYSRTGAPVMVVTENPTVLGRATRGWGVAFMAIAPAGGLPPAGDAWLLKCYSPGADPDDPPNHVLVVPPDDTDAWAARHLPRRRAATADPRVEQIRAMALMIELRRLFDDDVVSGCRLVERVLKDDDTTTLELMAASVALRTAPEPHAVADSLRVMIASAIGARLRTECMPLSRRCDVLVELDPGRRP